MHHSYNKRIHVGIGHAYVVIDKVGNMSTCINATWHFVECKDKILSGCELPLRNNDVREAAYKHWCFA